MEQGVYEEEKGNKKKPERVEKKMRGWKKIQEKEDRVQKAM